MYLCTNYIGKYEWPKYSEYSQSHLMLVMSFTDDWVVEPRYRLVSRVHLSVMTFQSK